MRVKQQRGGTLLGFIIGLVVGLGAALAVAVYVTKVPVPFFNKGQTRNAGQDVEESRKNKDWDPNAPLYGKNPAKPATPEAAPVPATPTPDAAPAAKADSKPAASADPLGDLAKARAANATAEPFVYFVQLGAFRTAEDAESLRVKLSLSGVQTKVTEREQAGRVVFRVRIGPFDKKEDAEKAKERMDTSGQEAALVRVQR